MKAITTENYESKICFCTQFLYKKNCRGVLAAVSFFSKKKKKLEDNEDKNGKFGIDMMEIIVNFKIYMFSFSWSRFHPKRKISFFF